MKERAGYTQQPWNEVTPALLISSHKPSNRQRLETIEEEIAESPEMVRGDPLHFLGFLGLCLQRSQPVGLSSFKPSNWLRLETIEEEINSSEMSRDDPLRFLALLGLAEITASGLFSPQIINCTETGDHQRGDR